jgi:hypothetical protein
MLVEEWRQNRGGTGDLIGVLVSSSFLCDGGRERFYEESREKTGIKRKGDELVQGERCCRGVKYLRTLTNTYIVWKSIQRWWETVRLPYTG